MKASTVVKFKVDQNSNCWSTPLLLDLSVAFDLVGSKCWCDCPRLSPQSVKLEGHLRKNIPGSTVLWTTLRDIIALINDSNETAQIYLVCYILRYKVTRVGVTVS
jgi:hypothetical protein